MTNALPTVIADDEPPVARTTTRRRQETRTREARERILTAAIDVLRRRGYSGLTTKEVAASAAVSNGALMHHFATKAELVVAATELVYDEALERGSRVAASPEAMADPLDGFIRDCTGVYFDWPFVAALEVIVVARTDTELMTRIRPVMERYREVTNARWLAVFRESGQSEAAATQVLNLTLNLIRGMGVNCLWHRDDDYYRDNIDQWKSLARGILSCRPA